MTEQQEQLERVSDRIRAHVVGFLRRRGAGEVFYAQELRDYVADRTSVAPASADRVLRDLRQNGVVDYQVMNRARSMYMVLKA